MKKLCLWFIPLGLLWSCGPERAVEPPESPAVTEAAPDTAYDADLARRLGADELGMKSYVMAFLKAGPLRSQDSTEAARLQRAHLDNIQRLAREGKLILAGPFLDSGEVRGIYIFNVESVAEARRLTATDPAIRAGRLEMELHPWYGTAALQQVQDLHLRIAKQSF